MNLGQLKLLRAVVEYGVPLRTTVRGFNIFPFIRDGDMLTIAPLNGDVRRVGLRQPGHGAQIDHLQPMTDDTP